MFSIFCHNVTVKIIFNHKFTG